MYKDMPKLGGVTGLPGRGGSIQIKLYRNWYYFARIWNRDQRMTLGMPSIQ